MVPDVVYLARDRYFALPKTDRRYPTVAPDIVVEILSTRQSIGEITIKRRVCLWWGVQLVLVVYPYARTLQAYDREYPQGLNFVEPQTCSPSLFPGYTCRSMKSFVSLTNLTKRPTSHFSFDERLR